MIEERDHMGRTRAQWEAAQRKGHDGIQCLDCQTICDDVNGDACDCCVEWNQSVEWSRQFQS